MKGIWTLTYANSGEPFPVSITIDTTDPHWPFLQLTHERRSHPPAAETYRIPLKTTPQRFGGVRWWFECPRTGRRCTKLFLPLGGHQFWSRYAWRLGYASQREGVQGRAQLQALKAYRALRGEGNWREGAPPKPKWMRWRTYDRLVAKLDFHNSAFDANWMAVASRFLARSMVRKRSA
jgi:hypothetical protein